MKLHMAKLFKLLMQWLGVFEMAAMFFCAGKRSKHVHLP